MSKTKRKKRIIVFEIRITVFTDFIEKLLTDSVHAFYKAIKFNEQTAGRLTEFEINERVIDGKTFAPFKRQNI